MSDPVKSGDTITVNYTGRFENEEIFDTSEGNAPLKFTVGAGQLIQGFDSAVIGMNVGDKQTVTISPEQGYGIRNEDMIVELPKSTVPEEMVLEVGMQLQLMDDKGNPVPAVVAELLDDVVKMDVNHPLAGKTLIFDIEVVETGLTPDPVGSGCGCGSSCGTGDDACVPDKKNCGSDGCDC